MDAFYVIFIFHVRDCSSSDSGFSLVKSLVDRVRRIKILFPRLLVSSGQSWSYFCVVEDNFGQIVCTDRYVRILY